MRTLASATLVAISMSIPAVAADLPAKAIYKAPPSVYNWSGCYAGANGGATFNTWRVTDRPSGAFITGPGALPPALATALTTTRDLQNTAGTFGAQLGCNWQGNSSLVLGAEGDFNWSGSKANDTMIFAAIPPPNGFVGRTTSLTQTVNWFGTIRGRIGVAHDNWLFYVTGGGAFGQVKSDLLMQAEAGGVSFGGTNSATRFGWTAGAGVETAIASHWTVKAEYLYVDLGTFSSAFSSNPASAATWTTDSRTRFQVVRAGLNYKFGGW